MKTGMYMGNIIPLQLDADSLCVWVVRVSGAMSNKKKRGPEDRYKLCICMCVCL